MSMPAPIQNVGGQRVVEDNDAKINKTQLKPDDFMKLMLAQLRMQNPLKPYDNSAMLQNMSQISSLNATKDLQASIKNLDNNMGKSQVLSASQLVGRKANFPSEVSPLVDGDGLCGSVVIPGQASEVTITIKDKNGQDVKTIKLGATGAGVADFKWDGLDADGKKMDADFYKISAAATIDGKQVQVLTAGTFKINSVALNPKSNEVILNVDGLGGMKMNEILKIL
jgi:flagellar basal-body rod modification protein FlgD